VKIFSEVLEFNLKRNTGKNLYLYRYLLSRFGPFYVEPIVAGLDPTTFEPYICNMDLIGSMTEPLDFVAGGTCEEQLMGMCETLWEPNMGPEQLFECISQVLVSYLRTL
jgi:20S proteasome alpha/beta subunit